MGAEVLSWLASVSVRALCLFAVAGLAAAMLRKRSAAVQHAVWTVAMGGMLLLAVLAPLLPTLPLRVLRAAPDNGAVPLAVSAPAAPASVEAGPPKAAATPTPARFDWRDGAAAAYGLGVLVFLGRLAFGYLFTRRLVRAARPAGGVYVSSWISVPMTAGWLRPKILLPEGWERWEQSKLDAVLAHERTHVRRADWLIAMLARTNRSIFWFHPAAWWMERRLAALAEQACDDAALLEVPHAPYAEALLDMAAAVRSTQGRLIWEAMAMAKAAEVKMRIERILDETRQIPREVTRARWVALVACGVLLVYLASVAQLERAAAQEQPAPPAILEMLRSGRQLGPAEVASMEQYLSTHPDDTPIRTQLILYYYGTNVREPRLNHIFWMIANHPENNQIAMLSEGVLPRTSPLNDAADYQRVLGLWRQAAATHADSPVVLGNAAQFLQNAGEYDEAERLLLQAGKLQPGFMSWSQRLGTLYAASILGATGDPKFPHQNPAFANRVKTQLENSDERWMVSGAASALIQVARRPEAGRPLPPGMLNLDDHPMLVPAVDFGARLMARADELGVPGGVISGVPGGVRGGVVGGIAGGVPVVRENVVKTAPAPPILHRVDPAYPPLALQARISGVVRLLVTIQPNGAVQHIQVQSGHPLLVPPSIEAVKQWTFQPPAAEVTSLIEVPFQLGDTVAAGLPPDTPRKSGAMPAPSRIRVGGNVQAARLLQRVDPVYPATARAEQVQGDVVLQVVIAKDGTVESADPTDGNPILARAAVEAVRQWKYQPTLLNGEPVEVQTTVTIPFELK